MGMPQAIRYWTPDEVRALPDDGRRYEVVAGELLVTPAPSFPHQEAVKRVLLALDDYVQRTGVGHAAISPADLTPEPGALVQPDVFVVALVAGRRPRDWSDVERLVLAVEVLSPSTARADRTVKRRLFQRAGVKTGPKIRCTAPRSKVAVRHAPPGRNNVTTGISTPLRRPARMGPAWSVGWGARDPRPAPSRTRPRPRSDRAHASLTATAARGLFRLAFRSATIPAVARRLL